MKNSTKEIFFCLLRTGLWENRGFFDSWVESQPDIDWEEVYRLASEQSVLGLVLAGLEVLPSAPHPPKSLLLQWIGEIQMQEQQNKEMNGFISELVNNMRNVGIYTILVKGQGIAQCYERPLWRANGDIDFLLDEENYKKAKEFLHPLASAVDVEDKNKLHLGLTIDPWLVELHGSLRSKLWRSLDKTLDDIQNSVFNSNRVRVWSDDGTIVYLPRADEDIIFVFSHILQHYYKEGVGLRQVCDWMRLLWTYHKSIDLNLLETRLRSMGVVSEWKAFSALSVDFLGMPREAVPLYESSYKWERKAAKLLSFMIETGNFGHNRDYSYYRKYPFPVYKLISFWRHLKDGIKYFRVFPIDSIKVTLSRLKMGLYVIIKHHK